MKRIQIFDNKDLAMGKIVLGAEAIMLKGAVVTAMAQKVTLKEDTSCTILLPIAHRKAR